MQIENYLNNQAMRGLRLGIQHVCTLLLVKQNITGTRPFTHQPFNNRAVLKLEISIVWFIM